MNIVHHPNEETILAHAAGTLDPALALVVTRHLAMCDECRERSRWAAALGAALLEGLGSDPATADLTQRALSAVQGRIAATEQASAETALDSESRSAQLWQILQHPDDDLPWRSMTPGINYYFVAADADSGSWARLFRFQPGVRLPRHSHGGEEYALVLQGSYVDESGHYAVGDFSEVEAAFSHEPVVDSEIPCIALIATTGQLRFEHPMYRAASRLFGV
jgi:putative transcriptional regulator